MIEPLPVLLAVVACVAMRAILRGGWTSQTKTTILGLDPKGLGISALSVVCSWLFFGPVLGLSLIAVVVIHEFGHVAAYRVIGHHDAKFRLVPLMGGYAISSREPATQEESVFVSLMGPAICLAPMVLAMALIPVVQSINPAAGYPLFIFASVCGALNFFNLLPIWPLDGGRLTSTILGVYHDRAPFYVFVTVLAVVGVFAVVNQRLFLLIILAIGAQHIMQTGGNDGTPPYARMSKRRATLCLGAWLFTTAAFLFGGIVMIVQFL